MEVDLLALLMFIERFTKALIQSIEMKHIEKLHPQMLDVPSRE